MGSQKDVVQIFPIVGIVGNLVQDSYLSSGDMVVCFYLYSSQGTTYSISQILIPYPYRLPGVDNYNFIARSHGFPFRHLPLIESFTRFFPKVLKALYFK
jgi:hypothetical protein